MTNYLRRLGQSDDLAVAVTRWTLVMIFALFGIAKFAAYEAEGVARIASSYPLFGWMYPLLGERGASAAIGTVELTTGLLIALGSRWPRLGVLGALMGMCTFAVTLSFMIGAEIWEKGYGAPFIGSLAQFLLKDAVLFAGCFVLAAASAKRVVMTNASDL